MGHRRLTEKSFMAAVVQYARLHKWRVYHTHDSRRSAPGWPDLALVRDGVLVLAELKVGKNRTTAAQHDWLYALQRVAESSRGAVAVHLWTPEDWGLIELTLGGES